LRVTDAIPANTALRVADIAGAGTGPVAFVNGTTSSGLTFTYTSLASATDDVEFSNNNGTTWTYTPVPDSAGCDTNVTNVRINPKGTFVADTATPNPSMAVFFRICVE
jgi:hypothetical protein